VINSRKITDASITERWLNVGTNKEQSSGLAALGKLRIPVTHSTILCYSALILILVISFTIRFLPVRWEIPSTMIHLNEFDPYYQYMLTQHMVQNGLLSPYLGSGWTNMQVWYPFGLNTATSLPALPMTAAAIYSAISAVGIHVDLMSFCAMVPVVMGTLACLIMYFIGKDMGGKAVGLFASLFLALAPSWLQRSSLGFFDTEVPGLFGLLLFILFFLRAIDNNKSLRSSILYSIGSALALAYFMTGWGAAFYMVDLAVFFTVIMIALRRYTPRLMMAYSITFGLALFIATKVPYISLHYMVEGPILPVAAGFILLVIAEILRNNISAKTKTILTGGSITVIALVFIVLGATGGLSDIAGKFLSVINPFARSLAPLIASVAEQTVPSWAGIYYDVGIMGLFFLVGLYFVLKNPTNRNIFLLLFSMTALYFSASMVRLLVIFAPAFAMIVAVGVISLLKPFFTIIKETPNLAIKAKRRLARVSKEYSGFAILLIFIILVSSFAFSPQAGGEPRVIRGAYAPTSISSASMPIVPNAPATEWLNALKWCQTNLNSTDVVVAWWDYGDWLSYLGNVTTLADNTTANSTQIENVGFIYMANETQALKMLSQYNQQRTQYILVFTTLQIAQNTNQQQSYIYTASFSLYGDEQKWAWMARISGSASERFIENGFIPRADSWTDEKPFQEVTTNNQQTWSDKGLNSTIYKLMSWTKQQYCTSVSASLGQQNGFIVQPDLLGIEPTYFTPAFISGQDTSPFQYGGIVPLVGIYKIDWAKYNHDVASGLIKP
jgi:dolichyl-diphosphooligosaccharide---protein glycosyltransferase